MRRLTAVVAGLLVSLAAACGDSSSGPSPESLVGTWNLQSLNGTPLPFVLQGANPKVELLNDQIVVQSNGTFTDSYNFRFTDVNGVVTTNGASDPGTWTLNGTAVVFRYDADASTSTATLNGTTFTIAAGGFSQVYTKQ